MLDKHAPKSLKRLRKKSNVPWFNKTVKNKLFQRDYYKRVAIKTNDENDWKLYRSSRNAGNIALRNAKREYYARKFLNNKTNPKHAWKTFNEILGRSQKQSIVNEINSLDRIVTSTIVNWLMFLTIILSMLVLNLLEKLNANITVAFERFHSST